ncbi:MAG: alpha/beta fold hydrolase [Acidimicrobiia bacterium]|nr:alpha/beta fold hydrolase [Acidimicrobiia bacterium]
MEGHRHRGGSRTGTHDGIGEPPPHPLVDERRTEGDIARHLPSLRSCGPYAAGVPDRLHTEWLAPSTDDAAPFILLHGFTQTLHAWGPFADHLADHRADHRADRRGVLGVDLPGHGDSTEVEVDLAGTAELLAASIPPGIVVGYSMGGRVALHLTLRHPEVVTGLVLLSTTAGIDDADDRAERRADDERLADHIETVGVDTFLVEWLARPLFAGLDPDRAGLDARRANTAAGLASSLRLCGTGTQTPLWDELPRITCPTLVVVGARDPKFRSLGERLCHSIGAHAALTVIADAGHNAPLERPAETATAIAAHIERW